MRNKEKGGLTVFILGLIIGGILFGSLAFFITNLRMDRMIEEKISSGNTTIIQKGTSSPSAKLKTSTTEKVVQSVTPAVVGIETTAVSKDMFNRESESSGVGTGFIVDTNGIIVTNQHVVSDNPKNINVTLKDGTSYDAKVIYASTTVDLAVIKIDAKNLPVINFGDSEKINIGQTAIAIGNPMGLTFERTVTQGIVSALNRSIAVDTNTIAEDLIQTDASINAGNSGGPLLNLAGEVIGINTYKIQSGEGLGFAIPINIVKPIIKQIKEEGSFTPAVIGIEGVDKEIARYYTGNEKLNIDKGILIVGVVDGSGADITGIEEEDIITKINGVEVNTMLKFREQLYYHKPGDKVKVTYERGGKENTVQVTLNKSSK
ncbi:trypsin-like peptidase domain-containing protein [Anaerofustis sp.]|uniref:S1C family serine protease n=1 Tax=Anaerofustis sp. TaxID=1872517 RepID=UPI0025C120A3|nr:trypsin-like peptidase domain-containing protein [Anaerofustis sp.]